MRTLLILTMLFTGCAVDTPMPPEGPPARTLDTTWSQPDPREFWAAMGAGVPTGDFQTCCDESGCWTQSLPCGGAGGGGDGPVNSCPAISCDPTLGFPSDLSCAQWCASVSARCYHTYRCGNDPSCPEAHVGYCGSF